MLFLMYERHHLGEAEAGCRSTWQALGLVDDLVGLVRIFECAVCVCATNGYLSNEMVGMEPGQ
jgi:hypothetical protein